MPDINALIKQFRAELLARDAAASKQMAQAYLSALTRLNQQLNQLTQQILDAQARGELISVAWLKRQERYQALLAQIASEVNGFTLLNVLPTVTNEQRAAINAALAHAPQLISTQLPESVQLSFNTLSRGALESFVGASADGSPLSAVLNRYGIATARIVSAALTSGIAAGKSPKEIARVVARAMKRPLWEAQRLARTEVLRAYREANREVLKANADVVQGWMWRSARTRRTCAVCWAMDGRIFDLDEPFGGHPACRCVQLPITKTWAELGITGKRETNVRTDDLGTGAFARLSATDQRAILGNAKYEAYKTGKLKLENLVGFRKDSQWGPVRWERSLADAQDGKPVKGALPSAPVQPAIPAKPQPVGTPVSKALTLPSPRSKLGQQARHVTELIDSVHGDGALPTIPVLANQSKKMQGGYWHGRSPGSTARQALKITVSQVGNTYPNVALAHEVGHFLDQQGIGAGNYASATDWRFAKWRAAIRQSRAFIELEALAKAGHKAGVSLRHVQYMGEWHELWARSYSQFIAARSKDATMLREIETLRERKGKVYYPYHWDEEDFAPVAAAIEELFMSLGWLK